MSIVAQKRKYQSSKNISHTSTPFSINGTTRNQGYIGQNITSRHLSRTIYKNGYPMHTGTYNANFVPLEQLDLIQYGDANVIKKSTMNTSGKIRTSFAYVWRPAPYSSTKSSDYLNNHSQSNYLETLKKRTISELLTGDFKPTLKYIPCPMTKDMKYVGVQPVFETGAAKHTFLKSSEYIDQLKSVCVVNEVPDFIIKSTCPSL